MSEIYVTNYKFAVERGYNQKILRLRYTLGTSSSSWKSTTSAVVCQQTIVMTTPSHQSLVMFENGRNH